LSHVARLAPDYCPGDGIAIGPGAERTNGFRGAVRQQRKFKGACATALYRQLRRLKVEICHAEPEPDNRLLGDRFR
jgi:hypothetical protein